MKATNIDEVLAALAKIVADTTARKDPLGYFPALYRQVTLRVKDGIAQGVFDDGARMNTFDAAFANAFLTAYAKYRTHGRPSRAWQLAFDRSKTGSLLILQDLLLGINAHINLDLGVVAGSMFSPSRLEDFHDDYDRINDILAAVLPQARAALENLSPRLADLTALGGPDLALALNFSVDAARDDAWRTATLVSLVPAEARPLVVAATDAKAKLLGRVVADPPEPAGTVARHIREAESDDVVAIIAALDALA